MRSTASFRAMFTTNAPFTGSVSSGASVTVSDCATKSDRTDSRAAGRLPLPVASKTASEATSTVIGPPVGVIVAV